MKTSLIDNLETILVTTIITMLVWLWAESKNVQIYTSQRMQVRFVAPPGQAGALAITPRDPVPVDVGFTTSAAQYDRFRREVNSHVIEIEVAAPTHEQDTDQSFSMRSRLNRAVFRELGISLDNVTPATEQVAVHQIQTYALPIVVEFPDGVQLLNQTAVEPAKVDIRLPANLASRAQGMDVLVVLGQDDLRAAVPNEPQTVRVPLQVPTNLAGPWTTLLTPQVQLTFTLRKQTETLVRPSVPIHINASSLLLQRFRIELPPSQLVVRNVELSGPADVIEKIRDNQLKVVAEIRPTIEEMEDGVTSLPVFFDVPAGVSVQSEVPQVTFTIERLARDGTIPNL